jgi:hypothetical protein
MAHDLTWNPLEPGLNPPHDTKHGNKTTCITISIHRMILDMIQGYRYLRRSTDRWTLSKNSTTRLKDSRVWRKADLLWECFDHNYIHPGFIFIPCRGMNPSGLRAQYLIPNLSPKCECLSIHSSLRLGPCHHAIPQNQRKQSLCRTEANCRPQVPLPNPFEETFLHWTRFFTKPGPQIRLPPVPNFGVNIYIILCWIYFDV